MSKHTPGPWKAIGAKIYSADQRQVAHIYALVHPDDLNVMQSMPNARLIAAAPELLDIVKKLAASFICTNDEDQKLWLQSQLVISKIEGDKTLNPQRDTDAPL